MPFKKFSKHLRAEILDYWLHQWLKTQKGAQGAHEYRIT
jgi:hypothetical protein